MISPSKNPWCTIDFNWQQYIKLNPDLRHLNNELLATKHYLSIGKFQNRRIK